MLLLLHFLFFLLFALCELIFIFLAVDSGVVSFNIAQNVVDMVAPFDASIGHSVIDLGSFTKITVAGLLSNFHRTVEMFGAAVKVLLLGENFTELHEGTTLSLSVLELAAEL